MFPLKRWKIINKDKNKPLLEILLKNRSLPDAHLQKFKLSDRLHDPYLLNDMNKAVDRIISAMQNNEKIGIFGDYDADGVISTVLMIKLFQKLHYPAKYFVPDRVSDGYGLKPHNIEKAIEQNINLMITVDNGISSNEAVDFANQNNIDVIITDHHLQEGKLPEAFAVVNPNRKDSKYPFKELCGAGVVYKLIHALGEKVLEENNFKNFMLTNLDLVCMATIADIVPLVDENYAITKFGLKSLSESKRPGLVELKRVCGVLGKKITPMVVGFYLAPRINAAGRLKHASVAVELLLSETIEKARDLANELNNLNSRRQSVQQNYIQTVIDQLSSGEISEEKLIIVENEEWEPGIVGLISGRIKEKYYRPVFAFTKDLEGNYVGSGRSIDNFHITEALTKFKELFLNYGGHQKAAGVTIPAENFIDFKQKISDYARKKIKDEDLIEELIIETYLEPDELNISAVTMIEQIGPFGEGNPEPVLALNGLIITDIILIGNGKHLKFFVTKGGQDFECIWWQKGELKDSLGFGQKIDLAFKPSINLWNRTKKLQLIVEDLKILN